MSGLETEPIGGTLEKEAMFAVIDDVTYELNYLYPYNSKPNRAAKAALQELCPLQDGSRAMRAPGDSSATDPRAPATRKTESWRTLSNLDRSSNCCIAAPRKLKQHPR